MADLAVLDCDALGVGTTFRVYTRTRSNVYTLGMESPHDSQIVWDEHNQTHLLVDRADRGITVEDVEHMLTDPDTRTRPLATGAELHLGRALSGRPLAVVTVGVNELYPKTGWWITQKAWRQAHDESL